MRKLENQWEKVRKEWKYYPRLLLRLPIFIPFLTSIILIITKNCFPENVRNIIDWLGKGFLGAAITQLIGEYKGNSDISKLLKKLNEILYNLYKWKKRTQDNPIRNDDIDYLVSSITSTLGEYSDDYEVHNIENEIEHIVKTKERIDRETVEENRMKIKESLLEHVSILKKNGFTDIDSITGTTQTYFADLLNYPNRADRRKLEREKNKKK